MIYTVQFMVDIFHLKHMKDDGAGMIEHHKKSYAAGLGRMICEHIPFVIDEKKSYPRDQVSVNDYPTTINNLQFEHYKVEVFAVPQNSWDSFKDKLKTLVCPGMTTKDKNDLFRLLFNLEKS